MTDWGDVIARVRGLAGQLLEPGDWRALCASRDLEGLGVQLASRGVFSRASADAPTTPLAIELAVRRRAGARLRILARWAGPRVSALAPIFDDEDRRSLRALVRGAVAGVSAAERVSGLIATPSLPIRALDTLSEAPDLDALRALLALWRHPLAPALSGEAARAHPDLFRIDCELARRFAARAAEAARRADAAMARFVSLTIDLENLWTALALADGRFDVDVGRLFVPGGTIVTADDLAVSAQTRTTVALVAGLRPRVAHTPVAAALDAADRPREERALDAMASAFRRDALRDPLSTAPIIAFALRQRAEVRNLLHITWGIALGATSRHIARAIGVAA
ncbi:MAG: V-type ATPase subunit [Gemmatimonadota bacterium]|nr:V-type ATPase subunit [Gemmatimonadota bacterium]